jgi:hypothetical protein
MPRKRLSTLCQILFRRIESLHEIRSTAVNVYDTDNKRTQMSSQETNFDSAREDDAVQDADRENDALASKLSNELNNWRRRRTNGRPKHNEGASVSYQSESARTIKLRGHETLVVRKSKLAKPAQPSS